MASKRNLIDTLKRTVVEMCDPSLGLGFTEEDRDNLLEVVSALSPPTGKAMWKINALVLEHPLHESVVGSYFAKVQYEASVQEDNQKSYYYTLFQHFRSVRLQNGIAGRESRVVKETIEAAVLTCPEYTQFRQRTRQLERFASTLKWLHGAFTRRARLLEQASNNDRQQARLDGAEG